MANEGIALSELLTLIEDYHDFNPSDAVVHSRAPTALEFSRQVSKGLPCIYQVTDVIKPFKASRWTRNDLTDTVIDAVEVAVTPNGRADSLCQVLGQGPATVFLQPANLQMTLKELFEKLDAADKNPCGPVYYLQSQNGNLTSTPLESLFDDLPRNFGFAEAVIGEPEAVNIWIGDERSVTSAHRDPYENLYVVLRGAKVFTLWPPADEVTLDAKMFRTGQYKFDTKLQSFSIVLDENEDNPECAPPMVPWVTIDPSSSRESLIAEHPLYQYAKPQKIIVEAGQMLYLPSGWYHHVAQKCGRWDDGTRAPCVSVNYWYDQDYEGEKYVMRQLVSRLTERVKQAQP